MSKPNQKKMKRLDKDTVKPQRVDMRKAIEILIEIQKARFDKHYHGEGLSIQERAEIVAINELFENE